MKPGSPFDPAALEIQDVREIGPFAFRWPDAEEHFERGWEFEATVGGRLYRIRHGLGSRRVYGQQRVHTVTWVDGAPQVEGVAADDYVESHSLLSLLRRLDGRLARQPDEVPAGYSGLLIANHAAEIRAPYSKRCLAVKIAQDDLRAWATHALLRMFARIHRPASATTSVREPAEASRLSNVLEGCPGVDRHAIVRALLRFGEELVSGRTDGKPTLTPDPAANELVLSDPFAFLLGVVFDQGIRYERAWAAPYHLRSRLGYLDPERVAAAPEAVREAIARRPALHRLVNGMSSWVVSAATRVIDLYGGEAARIWESPITVVELRDRLDAFDGIGQKKAAMGVMILARDLGVPVDQLDGSEIAYDIHVRRVFLRTCLADFDEVGHMIQRGAELYPANPGALDYPAWEVGRRWCHPRDPDCPRCPLTAVCPKAVARGDAVRGL